MKLLKFSEFINESNTHFDRSYIVEPSWWKLWSDSNKEKYSISQDAYSKTYTIKLDDNIIAIYDYSRNKVFTNELPKFINLSNNISAETLDKAEETDPADPDGLADKKKKEKEDADKPTDPVAAALAK